MEKRAGGGRNRTRDLSGIEYSQPAAQIMNDEEPAQLEMWHDSTANFLSTLLKVFCRFLIEAVSLAHLTMAIFRELTLPFCNQKHNSVLRERIKEMRLENWDC